MTGVADAAGERPARPGGLALTERALRAGGFRPGDRLLDVGCGAGATVEWLRQQRLEAYGVDPDGARLIGRPHLLRARGEALPFRAAFADGVLLECSLSLLDERDAALAECRRVLRAGGRLAVTSLCAQRPASLGGGLGRVETQLGLVALLGSHGFAVELVEDCSEHLRALWGQLILDGGREAAAASLGADLAALKAARCGYCLVVARKERP